MFVARFPDPIVIGNYLSAYRVSFWVEIETSCKGVIVFFPGEFSSPEPPQPRAHGPPRLTREKFPQNTLPVESRLPPRSRSFLPTFKVRRRQFKNF